LSIGSGAQAVHCIENEPIFSESKLTIIPEIMAPRRITAIYANVARLPMSEAIVDIDTALTAGPVIKKTNAAPGDKPLIISAVAIGIFHKQSVCYFICHFFL
jgi:hypothetical protein